MSTDTMSTDTTSTEMLADATYTEDALNTTAIGRSLGTDYFGLRDELTDAERDYLKRTRTFVDDEVLPVISGYWERAEFPWELIKKMSVLGIIGDGIEGYGCPPMSPVAAGLIHMELNRGDGSIGTILAVQAGLAMRSIWMLGSEEQKQRWLPGMARLDLLGAFALTEPEHGSDAVALETSVRRDGDDYLLNGRKRWIGNASIADLIIIWARDADGDVGGYVVEKGAEGYDARIMTGKTALRAVWQADITLTDVRVPAENKLPGGRTFADVAGVLARTRYTVAWRALGMALGAYEVALAYVTDRHQFGLPLASFQLVQDKLSRMAAEITGMQLLCLRLSELAEDGRLTAAMASLAKMNHAAKARQVVADARDILGGNGILLENHVARQHADMEAIFTFEGTDSVQSLIVGRELTGVSALVPRRRGPEAPAQA
jgi:glutaryl-CoA dehydrogenase